jgi:hypothetical protein
MATRPTPPVPHLQPVDVPFALAAPRRQLGQHRAIQLGEVDPLRSSRHVATPTDVGRLGRRAAHANPPNPYRVRAPVLAGRAVGSWWGWPPP